MRSSEALNEIAGALAKAQGEMSNAILNKTNPHFKSKYADLAAIRDAVSPQLAKHGIALLQVIDADENGPFLTTRLVHSSGQWIESVHPLPQGAKPQEFGSSLTYARRYSLAAICGISAEEDDDANAASETTVTSRAPIYNNGPKTAAPNGKNGKSTAADWAENAIEFVNSAKTAKDLKEWRAKNEATIAKLSSYDATAANNLTDLIDMRLDFMSTLAAG